MAHRQHICMLAAENATIPGAKVGGIGDVVRDIPVSLAAKGAEVSVVIPAYGVFHETDDAELLQQVQVPFAGEMKSVAVYERFSGKDSGVRYFVLHEALFSACGAGRIYCNDPDHEPFATDATKYAFFSVAALKCVQSGVLGPVDVFHLHDWHSALVAVLLAYAPEFKDLQSIPTVYSIHNLALQGIRPFENHPSSLQHWFPELAYEPAQLVDPRWPDCMNPMVAAIRLCKKIHTVSPTYAEEILLPNDSATGFHGGEGLELDLQAAANDSRLIGIINGISYSDAPPSRLSWPALMTEVGDRVLRWLGEREPMRAVDYLAHQRTVRWAQAAEPENVITSVGRLTEQKMALLLEPVSKGLTALEAMLAEINAGGVFVLLASGTESLEQECQRIAAQNENFLFLNRFDAEVANWLYGNGHIFLMPSSFEPCGISQMMAMRCSQPCLVHAVGGLKDTVSDNVDGFHFHGNSQSEKARHLVSRMRDITQMRSESPEVYNRIAQCAGAKRFTWDASAEAYLKRLYS